MGFVATKQILKKHVCVIHSTSDLSLTALQIADALLKNAAPDLLTSDTHTIKVKTLCENISFTSRNYKHLRASLTSLMRTVVEFNLLEDRAMNSSAKDNALNGSEKWGATTLLSEAYMEGGVCRYSYSRTLSHMLNNPSLFGLIDLGVNKQFSSKFGFLIYANCNRFRNLKSTPWLDLAVFRRLMGLKDKKYAIFRDLKRRVIDAGVKEVNSHSDMIVTPVYKKEQRRVAAIRFTIQKNIKLIIDQEPHNAATSVKLEQALIKDFGFSARQVMEIVAQYSEQYIKEKIQLIKDTDTYKRGEIKDLGSYLRAALEQDYRAPMSSKETIKRNAQEVDQRIECSEKYRRYLERCLIGDYPGIDKDIKQAFFRNQVHLAPKNDVLTDPVLVSWFLSFLKEQHSDILKKYMPFEAYYRKWVEESLQKENDG